MQEAGERKGERERERGDGKGLYEATYKIKYKRERAWEMRRRNKWWKYIQTKRRSGEKERAERIQ